MINNILPTIVIDSNEKKPFKFKKSKSALITTKKLSVGDYSLEGYEDVVAIERKEIRELFDIMTWEKKKDDFMNKVKLMGMVQIAFIHVEGTRQDLRMIAPPKFKRCMKIIDEIECAYGVPVHFFNDRNEASEMTRDKLTSIYELIQSGNIRLTQSYI